MKEKIYVGGYTQLEHPEISGTSPESLCTNSARRKGNDPPVEGKRGSFDKFG
jgi:hypothetical protein